MEWPRDNIYVIYMMMSPAEMLDRYTIIMLKIDRTKNPKFFKEHLDLWDALCDINASGIDIFKWKAELYAVNAEIWDYFSQINSIANSPVMEPDFDAIGRIALKIDTAAHRRTDIKARISEEIGIGSFDKKIDYYRT